MSEITVTKSNFDKEVLQSASPVLLDFWAPWCGPCRMLSPVVSGLAEKYAGRITVGKINVDEQPELAAAFQVSSIPMIVIMKDGKIAGKSVGYRPMEQIEAMLSV